MKKLVVIAFLIEAVVSPQQGAAECIAALETVSPDSGMTTNGNYCGKVVSDGPKFYALGFPAVVAGQACFQPITLSGKTLVTATTSFSRESTGKAKLQIFFKTLQNEAFQTNGIVLPIDFPGGCTDIFVNLVKEPVYAGKNQSGKNQVGTVDLAWIRRRLSP